MQRDGLSEKEAEQQINEGRKELLKRLENDDFIGAFDTCDMYGLEPDYLEDLF